jgi:hypothetical protein
MLKKIGVGLLLVLGLVVTFYLMVLFTAWI